MECAYFATPLADDEAQYQRLREYVACRQAYVFLALQSLSETEHPLETMDILRVKKAHLPLPPSQSTKKRKERKVTSAAAIPDADVMNSADTTRAGSENAAATGGSQPDSESESESESSSSVDSSGSE